ncbi:Sperm surface protein Sp17 [Bulinus truncatus]|nr:Sperm surface protein Sp17 [Bulinus truncatus]
MAVPFSNTKLRVPKGFQNILEAFAREVLRSQPENIHEFAAAYFENMMKVRAAKMGPLLCVKGTRVEACVCVCFPHSLNVHCVGGLQPLCVVCCPVGIEDGMTVSATRMVCNMTLASIVKKITIAHPVPAVK